MDMHNFADFACLKRDHSRHAGMSSEICLACLVERLKVNRNSAENDKILRLIEAAGLMRIRAQEALDDLAHGPFVVGDAKEMWKGIGTAYREPIRRHIETFDPATARAVADLLEDEASRCIIDPAVIMVDLGYPRVSRKALALAEAYLIDEPKET